MLSNSVNWSILIFVFMAMSSKAQMVSLTQIYKNPIFTNPSLIGLNQGTKISLTDRRSWVSADKGFTGHLVSSESFFKDKNSSAGITGYVMNEGLGNSLAIGQRFNRTGVGFGGAYHSLIGKDEGDPEDGLVISHHLSGGTAVHFANYHSNWNNLVFSDQISPVFGVGTGSPTKNMLPPSVKYQTLSLDLGANYIGKGLLAKKLGLKSDYQEIGVSLNNVSAGRGAFYDTELLTRWQLKTHARLELSLESERETRLALFGYYETNGFVRTSSFLISSTTRFSKLGLGIQRSGFVAGAFQPVTRLNALAGFWIDQADGNGIQLTYLFSTSLGSSSAGYLGNYHEWTISKHLLGSKKTSPAIRGRSFL